MESSPITVFAHRGMHLGSYDQFGRPLTENTGRAFDRALRYGFNAIECDLKSLKCGTVIVFHDDDLTRIAGIDRDISDFTLQELKEVFPGVLSFHNFHKKYRNLPVTINLEIKDSLSTLRSITPYLNDFISIVISSFKHEIVDAALALGFESAYLYSEASEFYSEPESKQRMRCHLPVSRNDIEQYRKNGIPDSGSPIYYYTVNGLKQLHTVRKLPRFGGFFTDNIEFSPVFSANFSLAANLEAAVL